MPAIDSREFVELAGSIRSPLCISHDQARCTRGTETDSPAYS
jgi:hypothetical protein